MYSKKIRAYKSRTLKDTGSSLKGLPLDKSGTIKIIIPINYNQIK